MSTASDLLFNIHFENGPLFKNQQDLVTQLLQEKSTKYYVERDSLDYLKAQGRLKTYISQLLSSTSFRSVTDDFRDGLITLITKKLGAEGAQKIFHDIVTDLKNKNLTPIRTETRSSVNEKFAENIINSEYICVITSKPLEVDRRSISSSFSLRNVLFDDFIMSVINSDKQSKYYRFNFPLESSAIIFWKGLRRVLFNYLFYGNVPKTEIFKIKNKFEINTDIIPGFELSEKDITTLTDGIINYLNSKRYVLVIVTKSPIYLLPVVASDPSDSRNFKLYTILDGIESPIIHKLSSEEGILWRLFVWDQLKSKDYRGQEVKYTESLSN